MLHHWLANDTSLCSNRHHAIHVALRRVSEGQPRAVLIEAESGMGKTSLVRRFLDQVRTGDDTSLCFQGRCYERESLPYKAFDGVMDDVCEHLKTLSDTELSRLLPANAAVIAQAFPSLQLVARGLEDTAGALEAIDPHLRRQRVFSALRELFVRIGSVRAIVVVVDDMQWSDVDSLVLLSALLRPPSAPKMLLIAIIRPEGALARLALDRAEHLMLGPLSSEESRALVDRLLLPEPTDARRGAQVRELIDEAQGHPLFLREIVRHGARARLDEALWSRVAALNPATRDVMALTSIAGSPIAQGTLASALLFGSGKSPVNDLLADEQALVLMPTGTDTTSDLIAELRHAGLIRTTGSHPKDTIEPYHDRVREAVLAHLNPEQKRYCHLFGSGELSRA